MVRNARAPKQSFSQVLKASVERETTSRGWCSRCQRYQSLATRKTIHSVPAVLVLNAAINSPEARQYWSILGWLPEEIGVILENGQFFCYQGEDLKFHIQRGSHNITIYSLIGVAADIDSGQHQKSHLVSLVNGMFIFIAQVVVAHIAQLHIPSLLPQARASGISSTIS
jgi:PAB-dependent poly(A)-specific ribonuclease subunit 2